MSALPPTSQVRLTITHLTAVFECVWFRKLAYLGLTAPFVIVLIYDSIGKNVSSSGLLNQYYLLFLPIWLSLSLVWLYYGHLAMKRFRFPLSYFIILALIWCNTTAFSFSLLDWASALTVTLGAGAALCFAWCWSESVTRLLALRRPLVRAGVFVLALAMTVSLPAPVLGGASLWMGIVFDSLALPFWGAWTLGVSAIPLLAGAYLSHRARRAARRLIETMTAKPAAPVPTPAGSIPAPGA